MSEEFIYPLGFYITRTQREMQKHFLREAKAYQMTPEQLVLLVMISENGGITLTELSKHSFCEKSYTTRLIEKMEKRGLIRREVNPNDKRSFRLFVTCQGENLKKEILPVIFKINNLAAEKLDKEEITVLKGLLNKIYTHLKNKS